MNGRILKFPFPTINNHCTALQRCTRVNMNQVFIDKFWLGKFCLLVGCVENNLSNFSLTGALVLSKPSMLAFEQEHLLRKKLTYCRNWSSVRVDKKNLSRKLRNCGRTAVLFLWWLTVMEDDNSFFCRPLCNCIAGYSENLLISSHKHIRLGKTCRSYTLSMTLAKEKLLVCNRLYLKLMSSMTKGKAGFPCLQNSRAS